MSKFGIAQAVEEVLREVLTQDKSVIVFGDNPDLLKQFGEMRVVDSVYGERMIVSSALGLAMTGAKVVAKINGNNLLKALDIIANEAALTDYMYNEQFGSSMVIRSEIGYAPQNGPQLAQSYESMFAQIPGLVVIYPSNIADAKQLMRLAIQEKRPVVFFENNEIDEEGEARETLAVGRANIVREGKDMTILSYGPMMKVCKEAVKNAAECGVACELIDLCTLAPLDMDAIIQSVKKTGKVMIVHEACKSGGMGAEISARIAESEALFYLESRILRVGALDAPIPYNAGTFDAATVSQEDVLEAIMQLGRGE